MLTADDILLDLESTMYRTVAASHPERTALACARALFECLFLNFRKQYMYVPTSDKQAQQSKYQRIWDDFTGHNHAELSIKYRLSVQQIYTITNQMRSRNLRHYQRDLFPLPPATTSKPLTLTVFEDYLPAELHRAGLPFADAIRVAQQLADYLCATYPGISVRITEALWLKRRQKDQPGLFDEGDGEPEPA